MMMPEHKEPHAFHMRSTYFSDVRRQVLIPQLWAAGGFCHIMYPDYAGIS